MFALGRWIARRVIASQTVKRAWLARLVAAWAVAKWLTRHFQERRTVRVGRHDDVVVTVSPRGREAR